jgi:hypothetical protein
MSRRRWLIVVGIVMLCAIGAALSGSVALAVLLLLSVGFALVALTAGRNYL